MRFSKRLKTNLMIFIMILIIFPSFNVKAINIMAKRPVKVGVLVYNKDVFTADVAENLKDIVNNNEIELTVFNANSNPAVESELLTNMLNEDYDLLLINIVGRIVPDLIENSVKEAKRHNIPIIFFGVTPSKLDVIQSYPKALIINHDSKQGGTLQGKMIADFWKTNKNLIDKNRDNTLQYVMIKGNPEGFGTQERTEYSLKAIKDAGIKVQELSSINADWSEEIAQNAIDSLFLKYSGKIEAIIANNDSMAIGAVKALQKYGYNLGDPKKTIWVYGINSSSKVDELIKNGYIAGTIPRDAHTYAEILYTIGMNLVENRNPLEGTNYKFDEAGVVLLPFEEPQTTKIIS